MWLYCLHEVGRCDQAGYCREERLEIQCENGLNMVPPCFGAHGCAELPEHPSLPAGCIQCAGMQKNG